MFSTPNSYNTGLLPSISKEAMALKLYKRMRRKEKEGKNRFFIGFIRIVDWGGTFNVEWMFEVNKLLVDKYKCFMFPRPDREGYMVVNAKDKHYLKIKMLQNSRQENRRVGRIASLVNTIDDGIGRLVKTQQYSETEILEHLLSLLAKELNTLEAL